MKKIIIGTMVLTTGLLLSGCNVASLAGGDEETAPSTTLYLKDASSTGVDGISYECDGGFDNDGPLITSGTTSSTGDMDTSYWPGYEFSCTITPSSIDPELYLYDANGPINGAIISCNQFGGTTGEDGHDGSIGNSSPDSCKITLTIN